MKTIYSCVAVVLVIILSFVTYRQWYFGHHTSLAISRIKQTTVSATDCHYSTAIFIDLLERGYRKKADNELYNLAEVFICAPDCRGILESEKQTIESYYPEKPKINCPINTQNN